MSMTEFEDDAPLGEDPDAPAVDEGQEPVSVEERARAMGWRPLPADPQNPQRHEYRGDPRRWTDAATFIEVGERDLPILRDQNRRMSERLARQDGEMVTLKRSVAEQADAVRSAVELAKRADERGYNRARDEMKQRQRAAVEAGDTETFDQIDAEITALDRSRAEQEAAAPPAAREEPPAAPAAPRSLPPETRDFIRANPWFNDETRPHLRDACIRLEKEETQLDPEASLTERFEIVRRRMAEAYPEIDEAPMPPTRPERDPFRRRAPASMEPVGGAPRPRRPGGSPIDAIADPTERATARAAYQSIRRGMPEGVDYTEAEYMAVYEDPHADVLSVMQQHRKK